MKHKLFCVLWMVIGLVSAYDTYLSIKLRHVLNHMEENPIGIWLINLDNEDVSLFMGLKFAGTVCALGVLAVLPEKYKLKATFGLFSFQMWLLYYLTTH